MPYIFNQTAKKKSPYYAKVIEADKAKQLKAAEEAKKTNGDKWFYSLMPLIL